MNLIDSTVLTSSDLMLEHAFTPLSRMYYHSKVIEYLLKDICSLKDTSLATPLATNRKVKNKASWPTMRPQ